MTIYNLYIFNRTGICIFYYKWRRDKYTDMSQDEEFKLMYGMLLSLRSFASKLSPKNGRQQIRSFHTTAYKLNYLETPTGLKFVLNTDVNAIGIDELLRQIYSQAYVETAIKNPLVDITQPIDSEFFLRLYYGLLQNSNNALSNRFLDTV